MFEIPMCEHMSEKLVGFKIIMYRLAIMQTLPSTHILQNIQV